MNSSTIPSTKLNIVKPSCTAILKPRSPTLKIASSIPCTFIVPPVPFALTNWDEGTLLKSNLVADMFALGDISSFVIAAFIFDESTDVPLVLLEVITLSLRFWFSNFVMPIVTQHHEFY